MPRVCPQSNGPDQEHQNEIEMAQDQQTSDYENEPQNEADYVRNDVPARSKTDKPFHLKGHRPSKRNVLICSSRVNYGDSRQFSFK